MEPNKMAVTKRKQTRTLSVYEKHQKKLKKLGKKVNNKHKCSKHSDSDSSSDSE